MVRYLQTAFVVLLLSLTGTAHALLIDFTSPRWADVSGASHTENIAGVGNVRLTAVAGELTFNRGDRRGCRAGGGNEAGLRCFGDGIGVNDDEITVGAERLRVRFSQPVNVLDVILLDLFASEPETALVRLRHVGGSVSPFRVPGENDPGGLVLTGISGQNVSGINFLAVGRYSDYAVAGIEVAAVPLPGALVLFLTGLAGIGLYRQRQRKA